MARAPLSLKARAIALLAQREQSRAELRRKLLQIEQQRLARRAEADQTGGHSNAAGMEDDPGPAEKVVEALLDSLAAAGYLDETRFVESRVHVRASRFGTQRIQQELAQHGLRLDTEQQAALRASELERAREVWIRRFGTEPSREMAEQARQSRFLLARGFAPEVVRRLLKP
ncbi:MAG: regulatory protein RecX [Roseateles sp.]|uniref:regulatory protein RecX n=1 Tax=Roseateles sp. TaxID=1971397 RepID=UPI0040356268